MTYRAFYTSPIGMLLIESSQDAISRVDFVDSQQLFECKKSSSYPRVLQECLEQIEEYFNGSRKTFTVPLLPIGTAFQLGVWKQLEKIPYGKTKSYKDIAIAIGNEKAVRAIGTTNGRNPIGIIVPCHRVIGSNGKLVGYASGVWRKEWLLNHEKTISSC